MLNIQNRFCFLVLTFLSADIASVIAVSKVSFHSTVEERIKQETKLVLKQEANSDYSCTVPGLIGEQPDLVCVLAKQLLRLRHYGDYQDVLPTSFIFKGKPGSGKKTAVKWIIKESGAKEIIIKPQDLINNPSLIKHTYEVADEYAKKNNRPVVIIFESPETSLMDENSKKMCEKLIWSTCGMHDIYHKNPYITTIYLYDSFKYITRWDLVSRCVGVFFNAPDKQVRKQIIGKYLPEKHELSENDIESMAYWTRGLSGGQLIQLIKDAEVVAHRKNEILSSQHINYLLRRVFWSEHVDPNKKTITMCAGIFSATAAYVLTRKYHPIWLTNIKGSALYTKIRDLMTQLKHTQQNSEHVVQTNGQSKN